jgi:fluoride exporter
MVWLAVGVGGALGSLARHTVNIFFAHVLESPVPYATAAVNLIGSFVIGLLAGMLAHGRFTMSANLRTFVFVGLLGGFTTFSSFALDTLTLGQGGHTSTALWNVAAQILLGLAAAFGGYFLGVGHLG